MTEALLVARGITVETMVALVKAGLATAHVERLARPVITVTWVRITEAGRDAIRAHQGTEADDLDVMKNEMVALAGRHVIEARAIVEHQRLRVQRLASAGRSIKDAERTLRLFERTLAIFEQHLHNLAKGADHASGA